MNRFFIAVGLSSLLSYTLYAETSVFGAGDLNSPNPYGLTTTEKVVVKNKKIVKANEKRIKKVDAKLKELSERIEALQSIFEGDSQKLNKVSHKVKLLGSNIEDIKVSQESKWVTFDNNLSVTNSELNAKIDNLQFQIDNIKENIKILKTSLDDSVNILNNINKTYVSRDEFKKEFDSLLKLLDKKVYSSSKQKVKKKYKKSNKQLMAEARRLFKKDYFSKAIPILEDLIAKKYRPAECNYYMGEIKYYRKKYKTALAYFKKSMMLYDKAKYIPRLLLHSAISFEKIGDKNNAQRFYATIVDIYPNSNEAKQASKKIK